MLWEAAGSHFFTLKKESQRSRTKCFKLSSLVLNVSTIEFQHLCSLHSTLGPNSGPYPFILTEGGMTVIKTFGHPIKKERKTKIQNNSNFERGHLFGIILQLRVFGLVLVTTARMNHLQWKWSSRWRYRFLTVSFTPGIVCFQQDFFAETWQAICSHWTVRNRTDLVAYLSSFWLTA